MLTCSPPIFTVRVPSEVSDAFEKLGYGIGMGPAGGLGGERQTSGIAPSDALPSLTADTSRPLAKTSLLISALRAHCGATRPRMPPANHHRSPDDKEPADR